MLCFPINRNNTAFWQADSSGCCHVVGNGIFDKCPEPDIGNQQKSWIFLIISGLATGASWQCYYHALQMGEASKAVPVDKLSVVITFILAFIFLHEKITVQSRIGRLLIGAGTLLMVL